MKSNLAWLMKLPAVMKCLAVGTGGGGVRVDTCLQGGFQHHLIIFKKEAVEELINISNTM